MSLLDRLKDRLRPTPMPAGLNADILWGILDSALLEMREQAQALDVRSALTAYTSSYRSEPPPKPYQMEGDTAVIDVCGPLMKGESFWCFFFGGTSYESLRAALLAAGSDIDVKRVRLVFDTPGGTVPGVADTVKAIRDLKATKPVEGVIKDRCCSAGYWLASQCDTLTANAPTAWIGNIGTVLALDDSAKAFAAMGIERKLYASSNLKGAGTPGTAITPAMDAEFQSIVDATNAAFLTDVATGRNLPMSKVKGWASAHVYLGQEALSAGLIDALDAKLEGDDEEDENDDDQDEGDDNATSLPDDDDAPDFDDDEDEDDSPAASAPNSTLLAGAMAHQDLPLASRSRAWDAGAAESRVRHWAGAEDAPNEKYQRAFLYYDSTQPKEFSSFKLPYADVIAGTLSAVPRGIFAAAARLDQTQIPSSDKAAVKSNIDTWYSKMRQKFNDHSLRAPWDKTSALAPAAQHVSPPRTAPVPASHPTPNPAKIAGTGDNQTMRDVLVRALNAFGLKRMAVAVVATDSDDMQAMVSAMSEQVKAEVEDRIAHHPLVAACEAAGVKSPTDLGKILDAAKLGDEALCTRREEAKTEAIRAHGTETGLVIAAQVAAADYRMASMLRDAWRTEADAKFGIGKDGAAAARASAPKDSPAVSAAVDDNAAHNANQSAWDKLTPAQHKFGAQLGMDTPEKRETWAQTYLAATSAAA